MRRSLSTLLTVGALLSLPAVATGKVALEQVRACGASGCATQVASTPGELPFELFGPTIETGRTVAAPAVAGPRYRITLTTQPVPGRDAISLIYLPESGYIHVLGEPGTEAGGAQLNTGWVRLAPAEVAAYDVVTAGVTPAGGEPRPIDEQAWPWEIVLPVSVLAVFSGVGLILLRRRRAAVATPGPA
jgi:hypothetical protein